MIRCLLVCLCSQVGHWYCTSSKSKPTSFAIVGRTDKARRQEILQQPELDRPCRLFNDGLHHDQQKALVYAPTRESWRTVIRRLRHFCRQATTRSRPKSKRYPSSPPPAPCCLSSSRIETCSIPFCLRTSKSVCAPIGRHYDRSAGITTGFHVDRRSARIGGLTRAELDLQGSRTPRRMGLGPTAAPAPGAALSWK